MNTWCRLREPSFSKSSSNLATKSEYTTLNVFSFNQFILLLRVFEWNIHIVGQELKWDSMKVFQNIFRLSKFIWLAVRWSTLRFLLTISQILLICFSNFNSNSKFIPSSFSLRFDIICTFSKETTLCVLELNRTWLYSRLALIWLFS